MRFQVSLLVKARNNSQSEKNILIFQLKSAFSTLILQSVLNNHCAVYLIMVVNSIHVTFKSMFNSGI